MANSNDIMHFEPVLMVNCEVCQDTGAVLSGEPGPSWKMWDPCYACDAEFSLEYSLNRDGHEPDKK